MIWIILIVVLVLGGFVAAQRVSARRTRQIEQAGMLRLVRKVASEDVTVFGEELSELHIETLTTELDTPMRQDYQRALDSYEDAKQLLHDATKSEDISQVTKSLEDGRYAKACVLARQAGDAVPARRPPCFFNPAHGPAQTDIQWAPPGGVLREIPVCLADAHRLEAGNQPDVRKVRVGNRMVPWYQAGQAYGPYAQGYYGAWISNGVFPAFVLTSMIGGSGADAAGGAPGTVGQWTGWDGGGGGLGSGDYGGDWSGGGHSGGHGGYGGDGGGGFDGGGGDGGGGGD